MHERALHVAKLDVPVLARRCGEDLRGGDIVPLALEAGAAHLTEEKIAQDDEGPGAHVRTGLEALARRPCLQQRFLDEIVREIAASRKRSPIGRNLGWSVLFAFVGQNHTPPFYRARPSWDAP